MGKSFLHVSFGCTRLTLSLQIFWQFCSLCATFFLCEMGIMESKVYKFSWILIFLTILLITFNEYPKFEISKSRIHWKLNNVCEQRDLNKVRRGCQSLQPATLAVCYDVADLQRWQWKSYGRPTYWLTNRHVQSNILPSSNQHFR